VVAGGVWSLTHNLGLSLPASLSVTATETTVNNSTSQLSPCNTALPIVLTSYTASATANRTVDLNWVTVREESNSHYVVERSSDNEHYEQIAIVNGKGSYTGTSEYAAEDLSSLPGVNYYRLNQVDINGGTHAAGIRSVDIESDHFQVLVLHNAVQLFSPESTTASYTVYSELGQEYLKGSLSMTEGQTKAVDLNLPNGVYVFCLYTDSDVIKKKVVIK